MFSRPPLQALLSKRHSGKQLGEILATEKPIWRFKMQKAYSLTPQTTPVLSNWVQRSIRVNPGFNRILENITLTGAGDGCLQEKFSVAMQHPPGGTQQSFNSFIRGGSAPRSKPLPFYIPFLIEKVPLSYTFHRKLYPFSIPTERLLLNFSLQKPLKYLAELAVGLFEIFWKSLLKPKCQFSLPFSILQLVKSLPFYIPPAW